MQGLINSLFAHVRMPGPVTSSVLNGQKTEKENTMLSLAIAMGAVVWAMIGYALLTRISQTGERQEQDLAARGGWAEAVEGFCADAG